MLCTIHSILVITKFALEWLIQQKKEHFILSTRDRYQTIPKVFSIEDDVEDPIKSSSPNTWKYTINTMLNVRKFQVKTKAHPPTAYASFFVSADVSAQISGTTIVEPISLSPKVNLASFQSLIYCPSPIIPPSSFFVINLNTINFYQL